MIKFEEYGFVSLEPCRSRSFGTAVSLQLFIDCQGNEVQLTLRTLSMIRVLATSKGVVKAAAMPPAILPQIAA